MVVVTIDSGPIEAISKLDTVPIEKWRTLMNTRRTFLASKLPYDCRCLVRFVADAEVMFTRCGFASRDDMIRNGLGLDPSHIHLAVEWLKRNDPEEAIGLDAVLGRHGGDRRSEQVKDQGSVTTLKGRGVGYITARLERDGHPELAEKVRSKAMSARAAAIEAGIVTPLTPLEALKKLIRKSLPMLSDNERKELRQLLEK